MRIFKTPKFTKRLQRSEWMHKHFNKIFLSGKILDVGCFEAPLRTIVGTERYTGIDIAGNPDISLNLEKIDNLPFEDSEFETVICVEVLEHLDNLHSLSKDLFRCSSQYVLISLPNAWRDARSKIHKGRGSIAHYGIPKNPPLDRHKWFFNLEEGIDYLKFVKPEGWTVDIIATEQSRPWITRAARKLINPGINYANKYCQTAWALYSKHG